MKKLILAITIALVSSTGAFAATSVKAPQECGATAEAFTDTNYNGEARIGFKLKFTLGKAHKNRCAEYDSHIKSLTFHERREESARATQQETKALAEKVQLCQSFDINTAPGSIVDLCGDLLQ